MKNWKTTLLGALAASITAAAGYYQQTGDLVNWQAYATAGGMALIGYFAKDAGVTGPDK